MMPAILRSPLLIWVEICFPGPWLLLSFFSPYLTLFSGTVLMSRAEGEVVQKISSRWNQNAVLGILTQLPQSHHFQICGTSFCGLALPTTNQK